MAHSAYPSQGSNQTIVKVIGICLQFRPCSHHHHHQAPNPTYHLFSPSSTPSSPHHQHYAHHVLISFLRRCWARSRSLLRRGLRRHHRRRRLHRLRLGLLALFCLLCGVILSQLLAIWKVFR
jgi:hypothetical protein